MVIETYVVQYLTDRGYAAYGEVPRTIGGEFVTVEKAGGSQPNHIDRATLAVQCWADTMLRAAELSDDVADAIRELAEEDAISRVSVTGPYNFTDPSREKYRYQMVAEIVYYNDAPDYAPGG